MRERGTGKGRELKTPRDAYREKRVKERDKKNRERFTSLFLPVSDSGCDMNKGNLRDVVGSFPCLSLSAVHCLGYQKSMLSHLSVHLSTHGGREIIKGKGEGRTKMG